MKRNNNKALYEKIMRNVSKQVKQTLNESLNDDETYIDSFTVELYYDENGNPGLRILDSDMQDIVQEETFDTVDEVANAVYNHTQEMFNDNPFESFLEDAY